MTTKESEIFIKQSLKLSKKYPKIYEDIENLKEELSKIAFKELGSLNKRVSQVCLSQTCRKMVWRIRGGNSNNNKGKRGGYRVFYSDLKQDDSLLLLGIFSRPDIKRGEYPKVAKELIYSLKEWFLD